MCREFIVLCRDLKLFSEATVAIDGRKFKARMQPLDKSIARHMKELDRAHRKPALVTEARVEHIKEKVETVKKQMRERYC